MIFQGLLRAIALILSELIILEKDMAPSFVTAKSAIDSPISELNGRIPNTFLSVGLLSNMCPPAGLTIGTPPLRQKWQNGEIGNRAEGRYNGEDIIAIDQLFYHGGSLLGIIGVIFNDPLDLPAIHAA
jgi:hypothetical protein